MGDIETELLGLIEKLIDGTLSEKEGLRLDEMVSGDPNLRRLYLEYAHQNACLHQQGLREGRQPGGAALPNDEGKPKKSWLFPWCWIALVVLGLGFFVLEGQRLLKPGDAPIATLIETKACTWRSGALPTVKGSILTEGKLDLATGIATILFRSGAKVVLEAPAEIELIDPMHCFLHNGTLVATVPTAARGFMVETKTARLADLGTEFGVYFNRKNVVTNVEVFKGTVDLEHLASRKHQILSAGQSSTVSEHGFEVLERIVYDSGPESPGIKGFSSNCLKITTAEGKGKDGHVCGNQPKLHRGNRLLLVKNSFGKTLQDRKAYLAFDLAPLQKKKIARARVQLQIMRSGVGYSSWVPDSTFSVYGITDQNLDEWDGDTLTWENAPANNLVDSSLDPEKITFLGRFNIPQSKWWGLASIEGRLLTDFLNSDTNGLATLVVIRDTEELHFGGLVHSFSGSGNPGGIAPTLLLEMEK